MATITIVKDNPVINALQKALSNTVVLTKLTQNAHWNVIGTDFFQLHQLFNGQYDNLFDTEDLLAERIRALDGMVSVNLCDMEKVAGMPALIAPFTAVQAVSTLIDAHNKNVNDLRGLCVIAHNAGDLTTENMVFSLIEAEQKALWMLKSYLK